MYPRNVRGARLVICSESCSSFDRLPGAPPMRQRIPRRPHRTALLRAVTLLSLAACYNRAPVSTTPAQDSVQVGYGRQAKRDVTGAVASVDGDVARRNA